MAKKTLPVTAAFDVNLRGIFTGVIAPLVRAGISQRAEARLSRVFRISLENALQATVYNAQRDGAFPYRTGASYRKMSVRVFGSTFNNLRGHILGPVNIYALEHGATIFPKNARALAIPLPAALRPDKTPKLPGPLSWKNIVGTFIWKSKATGQPYIVYRNAAGSLTFLYVLVESVQIKPRKFLERAWEEQKPEFIEAIGQAVVAEMARIDMLALARITTKGRRR